ncbi:MAG: YkgJ family cysteine cluster protein [Thermodesulfobacteriota bacterium]
MAKRLRKLRRIAEFTPWGLVRFLRLKLTGRELMVSGSCSGCGKCCRKINLEASTGWIRSQEQFQAMVRDHPEFARFEVIGKDEYGCLQFSCSWLTEEGLCRDHENRLWVCRDFPDKNLVFCGGGLPSGCGYRIVEVRPFERTLNEVMKSRSGDEKNTDS